MKLFRSKYILLFLGLALFLADIGILLTKTHTIASLAEQTSKQLDGKLARMQSVLEMAQSGAQQEFNSIYSKDQIAVYEYTDQQLTYWNNSQVPVPAKLGKEFNTSFTKLRNGYYLVAKTKKASKTLVTLCLIKAKYDLQNDYLKNTFADWLGLPEDLGLKLESKGDHDVKVSGQFLFSLNGGESKYRSPITVVISSIILFLSIICFLLFVIQQTKHKPLSYLVYMQVAGVLAIRFGLMYIKWPNFLYESDLYNLRIFGNAQSYFNSYLGDVLINSILLVWLAVITYYWLKNAQDKIAKIIFTGLTIGLLFIALQFHHHVINSIVSNSTISFDFMNLLRLSWFTYISLIPIVLANLAVLILLYVLIKYAFVKQKQGYVFYLAITLGITLILNLSIPYSFWIERWWFVPVSLIVLAIAYLKIEKNILAIGSVLLAVALISSAILNFYVSKNEEQNFKIYSDKLIERQDAVLESEFYNLSEKIETNVPLNNLSQFVAFNGDKEFLQLLKQNFFFGYFDRYNIEFSMFDENCTPLIKNTQPILLNEGFFEEQIRYQSLETASPNLFFIDQYKQNSRYIARIQLGKNKLYILFEPKFFEEVGAFPDLLIDESQKNLVNLRNLSYAVYRSGINNKMYGDFSYPVNLNDTIKLSKLPSKYTHHYLYPDENSTIVISTKGKDVSYYFTYNSYLFLFFSMIAYLSYLIYSVFFSDRFQASSLTRRIQSTVILLLLLSIAAVGITSTKLVSSQFDKDNEKQLLEKSNTILSELSGLLQKSDTITDISKELIDLTIKKYAYVFNSEISIFDNGGSLYITSQPRLYELGLAAPLLNSEALHHLKNDLASSFCSRDKAGNLNYLSLYAPIYSANKKLLGYLNLPYFGKQSELINELSGIISTLINVYVILFIISILSGLILSGYITLPLRILKQQMAKVTLGTKNEAIAWQSDDEVGKLVTEYNAMIEKLEKSAGLLAKSERELAWREMAKQVAHEIKNPLTPMKLNLQYLQHVIKNNPDDFEERFTKASNNIIEQIDTLANIATEFSNFAKLPSGELEKVDLAEIIHSTVDLFEKENNITIKVNLHTPNLFVLADKEQMLRVFNNLLKNAIQATTEVSDPHIQINSKAYEDLYLITISDNGCGIPESLKQKIFTPNFTTKSTGSGLGLAMIKNIFDTIGAKIWFESEEHKGSIFYLEFKQIND